MTTQLEGFLSGTKIGDALSPEQLEDFYARCKQAKRGFTGPVITTIAADFGVTLQHDSANNIRKRILARRCEELKDHADQAQAIAIAAQHGLGLNDAAAVKLSIKINDALDRDGELSVDDHSKFSLAISRLRAGDQRGKFLEAKLADMEQRMSLLQFDAVQAAIVHAKEIRAILADKTLDDAARTERIRRRLFGEQPADFRPVDQKGTGE